MEKALSLPKQILNSRSLPGLVIAFTLSVLGLAIWVSCLQLREKIRDQRIQHDGDILQAVSLLQQYPDDSGEESISSLDDPAEQFHQMMRISRLKGVLGIRLFAPDGQFFNAFPAYISEAQLTDQELIPLRALKPASRYYPHARLDEIDLLGEAKGVSVPLLVVNVPLQPKDEPRLVGVAQFIIEGESIAREFAELDRSLILQGSVAFISGGGLLLIALVLAFRRIERGHRLLSERTQSLLRANQELALAAKTSAVGAVTAHLIHGLKNPLAGLQNFVASRLENGRSAEDSDWQEAVDTTQRMQNLIGRVVHVLEEQQAAAEYEITLQELGEILSARMLPVAKLAAVPLEVEVTAEGTLSNREANLLILILENLLQNAIQASAPGKEVKLTVRKENDQVLLDVQDEGAGFPAELREHLFAPCRSTKKGGGGIGLAISKQLANHLGVGLDLRSNTSKGCIFRLSLPVKLSAAHSCAMAPADTF